MIDRQILATSAADAVTVWDVVAGRELITYAGHGESNQNHFSLSGVRLRNAISVFSQKTGYTRIIYTISGERLVTYGVRYYCPSVFPLPPISLL